MVEEHTFSNTTFIDSDGNEAYLGSAKSEALWHFFKKEGYIDAKGNLLDLLHIDLKNEQLKLPEGYAAVAP